MAHEGYIYLWRSLLHADFYTTPNTCHLAVYLMLTAAWKDHHILMGGKRVLLQRGQVHTGRIKLKRETGLSEQEIRTSLTHLENVGFSTRKPTSHGSIITICKYDTYQSITDNSNTQTNQRPTHAQHTLNHTEVKVRREEGKEVKEKRPADAVLQAYMARTTALLNGKTTQPLATALRKSYGAVIGLLKTSPELLDRLMEEIAGLPKAMPADWYAKAIQGKVNALRPGPGVETVRSILKAAAGNAPTSGNG